MLLGVGISCTISTIKNHGDKRVSIFGTLTWSLFKALCNQVFEKSVFSQIYFASFGSSSSYVLKWKPINWFLFDRNIDKNSMWNRIKPFPTSFFLPFWLTHCVTKSDFGFRKHKSSHQSVLYKKVFLKMSQCSQ